MSYGPKRKLRWLPCSPFCAYLHAQFNMKSKGHIRTFDLSNDCSTIGDLFSLSELYVRYDRRVMDPNTHQNYLVIRLFVRTYTHNSKLQVVCERSTYRMTTLLLEMSISCVGVELDARYEW